RSHRCCAHGHGASQQSSDVGTWSKGFCPSAGRRDRDLRGLRSASSVLGPDARDRMEEPAGRRRWLLSGHRPRVPEVSDALVEQPTQLLRRNASYRGLAQANTALGGPGAIDMANLEKRCLGMVV